MRKYIILLVTASLFIFSVNSFACVGKTLAIGAFSSANDRLLAQMMAVMINERTGTTVTVEFFDDRGDLFKAVEAKKISIFVENTGHALKQLGKEVVGDEKSVYNAVKQEYRDQYKLVMLKSFGSVAPADADKPYVDVPVVPDSILIEYPALPRVIEKLKGIARDHRYAKSLVAVESGDKPSQVAKDFLKKKRLI